MHYVYNNLYPSCMLVYIVVFILPNADCTEFNRFLSLCWARSKDKTHTQKKIECITYISLLDQNTNIIIIYCH